MSGASQEPVLLTLSIKKLSVFDIKYDKFLCF